MWKIFFTTCYEFIIKKYVKNIEDKRIKKIWILRRSPLKIGTKLVIVFRQVYIMPICINGFLQRKNNEVTTRL